MTSVVFARAGRMLSDGSRVDCGVVWGCLWGLHGAACVRGLERMVDAGPGGLRSIVWHWVVVWSAAERDTCRRCSWCRRRSSNHRQC